jgi:putative signal transducing protein
MKRLFVSQSLVEVESLKELLSTDGILCTIRNQQGSSLAGEVPFVEVFPELWVINDADLGRAKELLEEQGSGDEVERPTWVCAGCGERHVGLFTACWKCGRENDTKSEARTGEHKEV